MSVVVAWLLLIPLGSALLSWWLLAALVPLLQRRLLDIPNARSSHRRPTPRGGGLVLVVVAQLAPLVVALLPLSPPWRSAAGGPLPWLPLLCLPLALVGMLDDRRGLPASWRYGVQLLTGAALALAVPGGVPWVLLPLLAVVVTVLINSVNFMDGLDGLVAGCLAVLLATAVPVLIRAGVAAPLSVAALGPLIGALLGFLPWNWGPARVFMGDVGSTFLGAMLAGVVLQLREPREALGLLLVALPLLADAAICVLRRWAAGQPVFEAHRLHLYQRLHQAGWSHRRVAGLYVAATVLLAVCDLAGGSGAALAGGLLVLAIGLVLERRWALPFSTALAGRD